jgi:transcriptional regulator with XRE-family HTH domain
MSKTPPSRELLQRAFRLCLRNLRLASGIAQEKLALNAGIDRAYMSGLERGKHAPTIYTLYKLFVALDISFVDFAQEFERSLRRVRRDEA